MNEHGLEITKTVGVNGTVLGVATLSDLEIILKIILLTATIIWTGIKILDALEKDITGEETTEKENKSAKIHRPEDGEKERTELRKKRNGSGKEAGKPGSEGSV